MVASPHDFDFEEEKEIDDIIKEKPKDKKAYNKLVKDIANGLTDNKKPKDIKDEEIKEEKKYIQPPIIAHDSELPRITFEERNSGKLVESLHDFHFEEKEPEKLKVKKEDNLEVEKTGKEEPKQTKEVKEERPIIEETKEIIKEETVKKGEEKQNEEIKEEKKRKKEEEEKKKIEENIKKEERQNKKKKKKKKE